MCHFTPAYTGICVGISDYSPNLRHVNHLLKFSKELFTLIKIPFPRVCIKNKKSRRYIAGLWMREAYFPAIL